MFRLFVNVGLTITRGVGELPGHKLTITVLQAHVHVLQAEGSDVSKPFQLTNTLFHWRLINSKDAKTGNPNVAFRKFNMAGQYGAQYGDQIDRI